LIDALWGERPPAAAVSGLQVHAHGLRQRPPAERIEREGPGYRLGVESGELVAELEALVSDHGSRKRLCSQSMVALYRSERQAEALDVFQRARRTMHDELWIEPEPSLQRLQRAILEQDPAPAVEPAELRARRHLPAPATTLVGRKAELAELAALLRHGSRLVTLTGAGGIGKTRLALQAGHDLADGFADGVHFVDLAHLTDPELVPGTIAGVLGLATQRDEPAAAALRAFLARRQTLMLLDNFEWSTPRLRW
jgi:Bacterial transcriptional activator domain/NB-ARC domain